MIAASFVSSSLRRASAARVGSRSSATASAPHLFRFQQAFVPSSSVSASPSLTALRSLSASSVGRNKNAIKNHVAPPPPSKGGVAGSNSTKKSDREGQKTQPAALLGEIVRGKSKWVGSSFLRLKETSPGRCSGIAFRGGGGAWQYVYNLSPENVEFFAAAGRSPSSMPRLGRLLGGRWMAVTGASPVSGRLSGHVYDEKSRSWKPVTGVSPKGVGGGP
jgi:hypothetical protein